MHTSRMWSGDGGAIGQHNDQMSRWLRESRLKLVDDEGEVRGADPHVCTLVYGLLTITS